MKAFLKSKNKNALIILTIVSVVMGLAAASAVGFFLFLIEGIDGGSGFTKTELISKIIIYFLESFLSIFILGFLILYLNYKSNEKKKKDMNIENN